MDVLILCGSSSDLTVLADTTKTLQEFGLSYELHVASAHRTPARVRELVAAAEREGATVIIAAAGLAAHLAGAVASQTTLPVVGIPLATGPLNGMDALLSTAQMPPGVPVATVAIGSAGAVNSAVLAAQIVAVGKPALRQALAAWREKKARAVLESDPAEKG
jgi:phosphoribosylaminoimidazole carboxylase PurE protein